MRSECLPKHSKEKTEIEPWYIVHFFQKNYSLFTKEAFVIATMTSCCRSMTDQVCVLILDTGSFNLKSFALYISCNNKNFANNMILWFFLDLESILYSSCDSKFQRRYSTLLIFEHIRIKNGNYIIFSRCNCSNHVYKRLWSGVISQLNIFLLFNVTS